MTSRNAGPARRPRRRPAGQGLSLGLSWPPQQSCPNRSGVCNEALGPPAKLHPSGLGYVHRLRRNPVRTFCTSSSRAERPGRTAAASGYALAPAPLRERAGRLARDTRARLWLRPGEGSAHCAESPPKHQARCASRSGVDGLTPGPMRLLGRRSPAGQWPAVGHTRLPRQRGERAGTRYPR